MDCPKAEPNGGWFPDFNPALTQRSKKRWIKDPFNGNVPLNRTTQWYISTPPMPDCIFGWELLVFFIRRSQMKPCCSNCDMDLIDNHYHLH